MTWKFFTKMSYSQRLYLPTSFLQGEKKIRCEVMILFPHSKNYSEGSGTAEPPEALVGREQETCSVF